jgi:peptidoglycan L-alanyl-D-glutamate endopeptidase CwlK
MVQNTLRSGDHGDEVEQLQNALAKNGFSPGTIDGDFGVGTETALIAFQRSHQLLSDGVAGPRTLSELGLAEDNSLPDATIGLSIQIASRMCPGAPLNNIKANLPVLIESLLAHALHDRSMVLMAVATIRAETASFLPINEGSSKFNTSPSGPVFDLYDNRKDLGNQGAPDGSRFRGRGFIQLTGRHNYSKYGALLNPPVDLVTHPELANASDVAANLLCLFLGERERQIKEALLHKEFGAARRLVNGGSHGLADFTEAYQTGDNMMAQI